MPREHRINHDITPYVITTIREAKTRIRQRDWLKLADEKIRREQVGSVPTFLCVRANKFAKWKIGLKRLYFHVTQLYSHQMRTANQIRRSYKND